ncbi:MAG: glutaredoxin domain-containing protein [Candidatus Bathyarchaeota archaeon]
MQTTKIEGKNTKNKVFLYTLSTCGWCKKTKELLKEKEIAHEYLDLDKCSKEDQKAAVEELKAKNLPVAFPVIIVNDDKVIQGFKKDDILEALGL